MYSDTTCTIYTSSCIGIQHALSIRVCSISSRYRCTIFNCKIPQESRDRDLIGVSLSESPCRQLTNVLPVIRNGYPNVSNNHVLNGYPNVPNKYFRNRFSSVDKYTVCVSPLHDNYSNAHELIEWIELNKILGADKFIFYNFSCTPFVSRVINSYVKSGKISVLDWKLPQQTTNNKNGLHYFGQLSALNDCLLRNRGNTEFIVNTDLDEFIIPKQDDVLTWDQMLQQLPKHDVYLFLNAFFTPKRINSLTNYSWYEEATKLNLITLLRLTRDLKVLDVSERTKYFARAETTNILGTHKVIKTSGKVLVVPPGSALLQHYRRRYINATEGPFDDTILKKYKDKLMKSVSKKWKTFTVYHEKKSQIGQI